MCTVSVIALPPSPASPRATGFRVVCNRDEQRDRPRAIPPAWRDAGPTRDGSALRTVWPMDPVGEGTWIAASSRGLVLSLLNLNLDPAPLPPLMARSRGAIIPSLLRASDARAALHALRQQDLESFAPFRLLAVDAFAGTHAAPPGGLPRVGVARWDGVTLSIEHPLPAPLCLASSGLGDHRVLDRLDLFRERVAFPGPTPARQDEFHAHRWPERPQLSVMMARDDARTVSVTTVEVVLADRPGDPPHVSMSYREAPDPAVAQPAGAPASQPVCMK